VPCDIWRSPAVNCFIIASAGHFSQQTIEAAAQHGVPVPGLLVPLSGIIAVLGG
jgi:hypothetical protein